MLAYNRLLRLSPSICVYCPISHITNSRARMGSWNMPAGSNVGPCQGGDGGEEIKWGCGSPISRLELPQNSAKTANLGQWPTTRTRLPRLPICSHLSVAAGHAGVPDRHTPQDFHVIDTFPSPIALTPPRYQGKLGGRNRNPILVKTAHRIKYLQQLM
jgi:hypothetical protein